MVKARNISSLLPDDNIDKEAWLAAFCNQRGEPTTKLVRHAFTLATLTSAETPSFANQSCLQQSLVMADTLNLLQLDAISIAAAILYPCVQYADLPTEEIADNIDPTVAKLISGVQQMQLIRTLQQSTPTDPTRPRQENIRKMLLAMVGDVRVVLIKLAEQVYQLRVAKLLGTDTAQQLAQETRDIYAPLANRLGVNQIKWELEDLTFRYLEPATYKQIATLLREKRIDRERYIELVIAELTKRLKTSAIKSFQIKGRAKHIFSIYRKIQQKNIPFEQLYDISAIRILVDSVADCYQVLSDVHATWLAISDEFDDYISQPKPNGYQSLHTAVIGPQGKNIEIQIRTFKMHQEAELGVAAHWVYKEGDQLNQERAGKTAWLRQLLEWQAELSKTGEPLEQVPTDLMSERVYVFTPRGDIIDLPDGATPLDFAYSIHTDIGHRCRGAKINGKIAPLTHVLQTGEQIDIITSKQAAPSRDWLNQHAGYLKTSRAKAKVLHWFKQQDFNTHLAAGKQMLEKELKRLAIDERVDLQVVADKHHYQSSDNVLAALGCGDLSIGQLLSQIERQTTPSTTKISRSSCDRIPRGKIMINGVGDLLTTMARCCKPLPGDNIIGYVTQGRGVAIHRQDCQNILHTPTAKQQRLIEVSWGKVASERYPVDFSIEAYDRAGLLRDITTVICNEDANVITIQSQLDRGNNISQFQMTIEIESLDRLARLFDRIQQIPNLIQVQRRRQ